MIRELIAQLRMRAKEAKKAMKAKFMAVRYHIMKRSEERRVGKECTG